MKIFFHTIGSNTHTTYNSVKSTGAAMFYSNLDLKTPLKVKCLSRALVRKAPHMCALARTRPADCSRRYSFSFSSSSLEQRAQQPSVPFRVPFCSAACSVLFFCSQCYEISVLSRLSTYRLLWNRSSVVFGSHFRGRLGVLLGQRVILSKQNHYLSSIQIQTQGWIEAAPVDMKDG